MAKSIDDDAVDRDDERRRQPAEEAIRDAVVLPLLGRAAPAEGEARRRARRRHTLRRAIAHRREVGDEAEVPEENET